MNKVSRRKFLAKSVRYLTLGASLTTPSLIAIDQILHNTAARKHLIEFVTTAMSLSPTGCSTLQISNEKQGEVDAKLESHLAIPTPKSGCFVGFHSDIVQPFLYGPLYEQLWKEMGVEKEKKSLLNKKDRFGYVPAVHSFSDRHVGVDGFFPKNVIVGAHEMGVIPLIRFYPRAKYQDIAKGTIDDIVKEFAGSFRATGIACFFVPFAEANIDERFKHVHHWAGDSGSWFAEAYSRIHEIMRKEGANDKAVYGLHLIGLTVGSDFYSFKVPPDIVDWVGLTVYNLENQSFLNQSFSTLLHQQNAYFKIVDMYPTKPIALWEFGTSEGANQAGWIRNAYKKIREIPRIKLVVYAEYYFYKPNADSTFIFNTNAQDAMKDAISDAYFIKNLI
jgi:hypothetical protein